jgi:hypothetical protein
LTRLEKFAGSLEIAEMPAAHPFFITNAIASAIALVLGRSLYSAKKNDKDLKLFLWEECRDNINPASYLVGALVLLSAVLFLLHFPLVFKGTIVFGLSLAFGIIAHGLARGLNVPSLGQSCAMFALMLGAASLAPSDCVDVFALGGIFGLCWGKLIELRMTDLPSPVQDIAPACVWLAGMLISANKPALANSHQPELLGVAICITFLIRLFQPPFLKVDHLFVKRIAIAATGGMILLVAIVKYFHLDVTSFAWLFGFGLLLAYVADQIDAVKPKDNEKIRALGRTFLIAAASTVALIIGTISTSSGLSVSLFLAAAMLLVESGQTAFVLGFYWIATTLLSHVPSEFWAASFVPDAHDPSVLPYLGGAITLCSLACATYLSLCMPEKKRAPFDWSEPLVFICLLAFGLAIVMVRSWAPTLVGTFLDVALAVSVWHDVLFPKSANGRSQCMLFALMLVCLVYLFSVPAGVLLPFTAMAAIFRPREKAPQESVPA